MDSLDASFTVTEINKLGDLFEKVYVLYFIGNVNNDFSENIIFKKIQDHTFSNNYKIFLSNFSLILKMILKDTFSKYTSLNYILNFRLRLSFLIKNLSKLEVINDEFVFNESDCLYSFFTYEFALIPSLIKRNNPKINFITLTHGRDLYEHIEPDTKKLSFRNFIFSNADKILSVSKHGTNYLNKKYPKYSNKFSTYYLGTKNDISINQKCLSSDEIVVVSCSHIRKVKSVHLIPKLLIQLQSCFDTNIRWIHFGSFPNSDYDFFHSEIKNLDNHQKITYELKGDLDQYTIFNFYKNERIDFFISVSESEGLPISMMEVASFGIPIICTDVGGCREIVKDEELLLKKDFTLNNFLDSYNYLKLNEKEIRNEIYQNWQTNFSYSISYSRLSSILLEI